MDMPETAMNIVSLMNFRKITFCILQENLQIFIVAITQKLITCEGYERYIEPRQHVAKVCTNVLFVYV